MDVNVSMPVHPPEQSADQSAERPPAGGGRPGAAAGGGARQLVDRLLSIACWINLAVAIAVLLLIRWSADRWWAATLMAYGPRWVWAAPSGLLLLPIIWRRRRMTWAVVAALVVVLGPLMGLCLSWPRGDAAHVGRPTLRTLSCNIEGSHTDPIRFARVLERFKPDVVALQECAGESGVTALFSGAGWHRHQSGGRFLASRFPIASAEVMKGGPNQRDVGVAYIIEAPWGAATVINVHLETPRGGFEAILGQHLQGIDEMERTAQRQWSEAERVRRKADQMGPGVCILGDFNTVADSPLFRGAWVGYADAFGEVGNGYGYTKFTRKWGVRIDHVLAGAALRVERCEVGPDVGSDHRPLAAELSPADSQ